MTAGSFVDAIKRGCRTLLPASAERSLASRSMLPWLAVMRAAGGRRRTICCEPQSTMNNALAMPASDCNGRTISGPSPLSSARIQAASAGSKSSMLAYYAIYGRLCHMIDFELPQDIQALRARVARFIDDTILPAEKQIGARP